MDLTRLGATRKSSEENFLAAFFLIFSYIIPIIAAIIERIYIADNFGIRGDFATACIQLIEIKIHLKILPERFGICLSVVIATQRQMVSQNILHPK